MGGRREPATHSLREEERPEYRLEDMGDDERAADDADAELEQDADADGADDVEAHSLPLPPPRPMNGL